MSIHERTKVSFRMRMSRSSVRDFDRTYAWQESVELASDDLITFARPRLESSPIDNPDTATAVIDEVRLAKLAGRLSHTFTANTEHVGNQLLCDLQIACARAVDVD
jgi:hypothetical protein